MAALTLTPDLYRAGASYAGVMDLKMLLRDDRSFRWRFDFGEAMIGGGRGDGDRLAAASPLRNVAAIRAPVLLGHGEDDSRVQVSHSRQMAEALRAAGKPVEYLEFEHEIHGFVLAANRVRFYQRLADFMTEHTAPRTAPAAPAPRASRPGAAPPGAAARPAR